MGRIRDTLVAYAKASGVATATADAAKTVDDALDLLPSPALTRAAFVALAKASGVAAETADAAKTVAEAAALLPAIPKKATAQADSTATEVAGLVTDFNALLAKLRTSGVISST